jgi:hypothetical protein
MSLKLYEITPSLTPFTVDLLLSAVELAACSVEPIKLIPKICPNSRLEYIADSPFDFAGGSFLPDPAISAPSGLSRTKR